MSFSHFRNIMNNFLRMDDSETLSKLQSMFTAGEDLVFIHEAGLLDGWIKTSRVLVFVENLNSYGFFVFDVIRGLNGDSELNIEHAFPINNEFKVYVDNDENCLDISVTVSFRNVKLTFEMNSSEKTKQFISELHKILENASKKEDLLDFGWLAKYKIETAKDRAVEDDSMKESQDEVENYVSSVNSDLLIPRHSIARGTTPIAGRESVVRYQMTLKENDYTYTQPIRIFVGTWNVNGQAPSVPLSEWLNCDNDPPDIYAIGFQELDLSKEAYLFNDSNREEEWLQAVTIGLKQKEVKYNKLALIRLVGMMLIVFVKEKHYAYIRDVATHTVGTGILNKLGNKGGVAVRFDIHSTSICFVNAHLAAHVEEVERRNQDYRDICSRMSFSKFLPPKTIKDHDQIYWLGDLNYRINMDAFVVKSLIENNNFDEILNYDQLKQNHREGRAFEKYLEGEITFKPTYKYNTGSDEWDSSEKNRAPAWCDRILWRGEQVTQIAYRSHPSLKISDHKPVSAVFISYIRVIDVSKYRKIHEEVMKKLDKLENEFLPHVTVETTEIVFGNVHFLETHSKSLTIANTGQVPVRFEFIKKLDDNSYCKNWLHIEPYIGDIMPGDKCDVQLELCVDKRSACDLNFGKDNLYDILVLHLEGGKDIFITITGTYIYSSFGMSLDVLSRIKVPIREITKEELLKFFENADYGRNESYPVPKEIWYLVDHLYRNGMKQPHLFEEPGLHSELLQIRDWLDTGVPEHIPGSIHSVAEALLVMLDSISEPLIPYTVHSDCLNASSNYLLCKQIITTLPPLNRTVFLYLCTFLQELLSYSEYNNLDAKTIATVFGTTFIRDPPQGRVKFQLTVRRAKTDQQTIDRKKAAFLHHFLVNDQSELIANIFSSS